MKNQYFGDVSDYRKYGNLRLIGDQGSLQIGVCWMLTPDDTRPDGRKTGYLDHSDGPMRAFDSELFDMLRLKVHGHETEPASRDVLHFNDEHLPGASFWSAALSDHKADREDYFEGMWEAFSAAQVQLIFFDPDDGLAFLGRGEPRLKKGHKDSSKKLFDDEIRGSLDRGFSVLFYQHFTREARDIFVDRIACLAGAMSSARRCFSFRTPHTVFYLVPHPEHMAAAEAAVARVRDSHWAQEGSCRTSKGNGRRQILVEEHLV